ncbi:hypothetical protein GQ44DRAFT_683776 [Phaeosphaeriaceae sp. PMI808]|nr:hypothetical protein GQ44DRAFT_683776 [Phaeosphaeriaceae sp. PMI808]
MFLITTGILLAFSTIAVSLRLYCRIAYVHYAGIDDYCMVIALLVSIGMGVMNVFHIGLGTGRHGEDLDLSELPSQAWSPLFPKGCNNLPTTYFSTASINILTDVVILLMPLRAFGQLQINARKRWALIGVFMVGGMAVVASTVRLYALWLYTNTQDVAYDAIFILLLSQIEVNVAIISASAPALRPLLSKTSMSFSSSNSIQHTAGYSSSAPTFHSRRSRSPGQIELELSSKDDPITKHNFVVGKDTHNTSEERILGIMKTVETNVNFEQDCRQNQGQQVRPPF